MSMSYHWDYRCTLSQQQIVPWIQSTRLKHVCGNKDKNNSWLKQKHSHCGCAWIYQIIATWTATGSMTSLSTVKVGQWLFLGVSHLNQTMEFLIWYHSQHRRIAWATINQIADTFGRPRLDDLITTTALKANQWCRSAVIEAHNGKIKANQTSPETWFWAITTHFNRQSSISTKICGRAGYH